MPPLVRHRSPDAASALFPWPVLVGDVGGTNARFSLAPAAGVPLSPAVRRLTRDFPSLEAAIEDVIPSLPERPRSAVICAAGRVVGRAAALTNARWHIDGATAAGALGLEQGLLLNDFEAQALSLPVVDMGWTHRIGQANGAGRGAELVLGLGTGLGASALLLVDGRHFALASEAGHVDFGPVGSEEAAIWPQLSTAHGRVSVESLLSGSGLPRLHRARLAVRGLAAYPSLDARTLVERAHADATGAEADTVRMIWTLAGRFAADMALVLLATGGVTFSGGILPRIVDLVDPAGFRAAFESKAPFGEVLRGIETRLLMKDDAVLSGMRAIAERPGRYLLDYETRLWR